MRFLTRVFFVGLSLGLMFCYFRLWSQPAASRQAPLLATTSELLHSPGTFQNQSIMLTNGAVSSPVFVFGRCFFWIVDPETGEQILAISPRFCTGKTIPKNVVYKFEIVYADGETRWLVLREVKFPA